MICAQKKRNVLVAVALTGGVTFIVALVHYIHQSPYPIILSQLAGESGRSSRTHFLGAFGQDAEVLRGYVSLAEEQPLALRCQQCSIVSSSGQMLGTSLGAEIDQSECVWRMNNAPTEGYQTDVGSKTTVRVVSHTSTPLLLRQEPFTSHLNSSIYIFWGPQRNMRRDGKGVVYNILRTVQNHFPSARLYILTEEQMRYCDIAFKRETGKDRTEGHRNVPYHYYEANGQEECAEYYMHENARYGGHRFITEKSVFAKWAKERKIKFFNPTWQIS
ncbi:alpha-N-acetylgalactosaminide alpha-2,6-sialyltransferase 3-like isoform X2 [Heterodontus francisci]|uniref:alpha-N-acetylgalactosaminide alpha-2,6-sialyltransferase 3-like isoform X2 n=1 Tax=Heterodontus francisci TaxID=7792 RepID=UPI00355B98DD